MYVLFPQSKCTGEDFMLEKTSPNSFQKVAGNADTDDAPLID
jgi:hypothetical protein